MKEFETWHVSIWDHADTSPVEISNGAAAVIGNIWCTEAFGGTPDPIIQDGSNVLWPVDTSTALRAEVISLKNTECPDGLRITSTAAGTAGKLAIQWRYLS